MVNLEAEGTTKPRVFQGMVAFSRDERDALWRRRKGWKNHSNRNRVNREFTESLSHSLMRGAGA